MTRMWETARRAVERNWFYEAHWRLRFGVNVKIRGRVQIDIGAKAMITAAPLTEIGVRLLGAATLREARTIIVVGAKGRLDVGGAMVGRGVALVVGANAELKIGSGSYITDGSRVLASQQIRIGDRCAISWGVTILDDDGHGFCPPPYSAPIILEDDIWVGCNVTILKGVTIGRGSVVGAGAVVTRSCPPHSLLVGVPARVVKTGITWTDAHRCKAVAMDPV